MKKWFKVSLFMILAICLVSGSAMAFPFIEVEGFVYPSAATITDNGNGTSTINGLTYIFNVTGDGGFGAEMNFLSLEFENDVFQSVSTAFEYSPENWISSNLSSIGSWYTMSSAGTTIGIGESLKFAVDVVIFNDALTDDSLWNEGQVWGQSWYASDNMRGGDGGSTAPVPEPATLLLLGCSLVGLARVSHNKLKKA